MDIEDEAKKDEPGSRGNGASPKRRKSKQELRREEDQRILQNAAILRAMPDNIGEALANARSQPIWCSDRRWRMEMSRRRHRYLY